MLKKLIACSVAALALGQAGLAQAGTSRSVSPAVPAAFSCGMFGPAVTNSIYANLGSIATAMFATSGESMPADFLDQGPWFLIDSYGSGALMGCQPSTSTLSTENAPRQNTYNQYGMLVQQIAQRNTGDGTTTPATLRYSYLPGNPYLISYAEQFCISSVGTQLNRITFLYNGNQLAQIKVAADSGCPNGGATYTYSYGSSVAPGLPSKVVIVNDQEQTATELFNYTASNNLLQAAYFAGGQITYGYSGTQLTRMNLVAGSTTPLNIGYTATQQWSGATDPRHGWGLTISYSNNVVSSTLQNTGCPGVCQPSTFQYGVKSQGSEAGACAVSQRQQHVADGRAYVRNGQVYAQGSNQLLGPVALQRVDRLRQRAPGQYYLDRSCR